MSDTKRCTKCGEVKPLTEFYRVGHGPSRLSSRCKDCLREYARKYYYDNRENPRERSAWRREVGREGVREGKERERAWEMNDRRKNPERYLIRAARHRARKKGIAFNLTPGDAPVPTHCPVLGLQLSVGKDDDGYRSSPSIDRIKPELGYVKGNVQVISCRANTIKNDATGEEIIRVGLYGSPDPQEQLRLARYAQSLIDEIFRQHRERAASATDAKQP